MGSAAASGENAPQPGPGSVAPMSRGRHVGLGSETRPQPC